MKEYINADLNLKAIVYNSLLEQNSNFVLNTLPKLLLLFIADFLLPRSTSEDIKYIVYMVIVADFRTKVAVKHGVATRCRRDK